MEAFELTLAGETFRVPLRQVGDVRIAYLDFLCDVRLVRHCARELTSRLPVSGGPVVVPATGAIPLGFLVAEMSNRPLVVLRKEVRGYMGDVLQVPVQSMASSRPELLMLERRYLSCFERGPATLLDTVTTSGSTLNAMSSLMETAGIAVGELACAFVEGDAPIGGVIHLGTLPVFPGNS